MVELDEEMFNGYNAQTMSVEDINEKVDLIKEMIYPYIFGRKYEEYFESDIVYNQVQQLSDRLDDFTDELYKREINSKENHSYW